MLVGAAVTEHIEKGNHPDCTDSIANKATLSDRDLLKVDGAVTALGGLFLFPPTRRLLQTLTKASLTQPGLTEQFVPIETNSNYLRNIPAEYTFWTLFKQRLGIFSRMTDHVLDDEVLAIVEKDDIKSVVFENSPSSLAWVLRTKDYGGTVRYWWRPDLGASETSVKIDQRVSRACLENGRIVFTIDCEANDNQLEFTAENIGVSPSLATFIGGIGAFYLMLFAKEIAAIATRKIPNYGKGEQLVKVLSILGVMGVAGNNALQTITQKEEGPDFAVEARAFDSWLSEQLEGVNGPNSFIGFDAYLTLFRNSLMKQNINRVVSIFGGFPEFAKQFIGAGGGHAEIWRYIHKDLPGDNEKRITEFANRLIESTLLTFVVLRDKKHGTEPINVAWRLSFYAQMFGDFNIAGARPAKDGAVSDAMIGVYSSSIQDERLIPPSPRTILLSTLRKKLGEIHKDPKAVFEAEVLSHLALMIGVHAYDETATLLDQASFWKGRREGYIATLNDSVRTVAVDLYSKLEPGYLHNVLFFADNLIKTNDRMEINLSYMVSQYTGDIILGTAIHNGTVLPLIRKFTPSLKNNENPAQAAGNTHPDSITAQDGFMLPGGLFIPLDQPEIKYRQIQRGSQYVNDSPGIHSALHVKSDSSVELVRANHTIYRNVSNNTPSIMYIRDTPDTDSQLLNLDQILVD